MSEGANGTVWAASVSGSKETWEGSGGRAWSNAHSRILTLAACLVAGQKEEDGNWGEA